MRHSSLFESARLEAETVRRVDPQLERVLDGNDPLVAGDEFDEGIE